MNPFCRTLFIANMIDILTILIYCLELNNLQFEKKMHLAKQISGFVNLDLVLVRLPQENNTFHLHR